MSPAVRSLIWKEWRERRVALALCTVWMAGCVVYAWWYSKSYAVHAPVGTFSGSAFLFAAFAPVFLAMRVSLGEVTQGTLRFTAAMPASLRTMALVRFAGATLCLVVPLVISVGVMSIPLTTGELVQAQRREWGPQSGGFNLQSRPVMPSGEAVGFLWTATAIGMASGVSLLVPLCLLGTWLRSEGQLGFFGAVGVFMWTLAMGLGPATRDTPWWGWTAVICPHSIATHYSYQDANYISYQDLDIAPRVWGPLALNLALILAGVFVFSRLYGSQLVLAGRTAKKRWWSSWSVPRFASWLAIRPPGRLGALVWLNLRQALPMTIAGLMIAVLMVIVDRYGQLSTFQRFDDLHQISLAHSLAEDARYLAGNLTGSVWIVATFWSAIVGAGMFAGELSPKLGQFWRSRPISPTVWFWTKSVVGLAAVLGVLDLTTILVSWKSPVAQSSDRMGWSYVYCLPLLHSAVFAISAAVVCWWRRPVAAAAIALGCFMMTDVVMMTPGLSAHEPLMVYNAMIHGDGQTTGELHGVFDPAAAGYGPTYGTIAVLTMMLMVVAWREAVREEVALPFDWGRQRKR